MASRLGRWINLLVTAACGVLVAAWLRQPDKWTGIALPVLALIWIATLIAVATVDVLIVNASQWFRTRHETLEDNADPGDTPRRP